MIMTRRYACHRAKEQLQIHLPKLDALTLIMCVTGVLVHADITGPTT